MFRRKSSSLRHQRHRRVVIVREGDGPRCTCQDLATAERIARDKEAGQYLARRIDATSFRVDPAFRGVLKQALVGAGYPAEDLAGYVSPASPSISCCVRLPPRARWQVRDYQRQAAEAFYLAGSERGGSGVIVLPCRAPEKRSSARLRWTWPSKTSLVLTTSLTSVKQWPAPASRQNLAQAGRHRRLHR